MLWKDFLNFLHKNLRNPKLCSWKSLKHSRYRLSTLVALPDLHCTNFNNFRSHILSEVLSSLTVCCMSTRQNWRAPDKSAKGVGGCAAVSSLKYVQHSVQRAHDWMITFGHGSFQKSCVVQLPILLCRYRIDTSIPIL